MSTGNKVGKVVEWSVSSIVGNVAWACVYAFIVWVFNERTGCLAVVSAFASAHGAEFAAWSLSSLLFGVLVGALIRHRVAIRQLAAKDDEIAELEKRQTREEPEREPIEPTPDGIASLTSIMAYAVWSAYENGDMSIGEAHEEVWASIIDEEGIFERICQPYMGARNPTDKYRLTSKWRIALRDEATLDLVKIAARGY